MFFRDLQGGDRFILSGLLEDDARDENAYLGVTVYRKLRFPVAHIPGLEDEGRAAFTAIQESDAMPARVEDASKVLKLHQ
jgi:hypothetical protein